MLTIPSRPRRSTVDPDLLSDRLPHRRLAHRAAIFRKDDATGNVFYVGQVEADHRTMDNVMIFEHATNSPFREVINAETAVVDGRPWTSSVRASPSSKRDGALNGASRADDDWPAPRRNARSVRQHRATTTTTPEFEGHSRQINAMESTGQGGSTLDVEEDHISAETLVSVRLVHRRSARPPARRRIREEGPHVRNRALDRSVFRLLPCHVGVRRPRKAAR